jgi:hypothetical protein
MLVFTLLTVSVGQAARLYRWVDEEGNVHYTDKIPPAQVERGHQELSKDGVKTREVPRAKTKEEVERERELKQLRMEQQRLIEMQKAEDRVLLRTFRSEDDLLLARDGKLAAIDVQMKVIQGNIRRYQQRLSNLQHRAATLERSGKPLPESLLANIETTLQNINQSYSSIERKEQSKNAIRETFERDLNRFRELKNITPEKQTEQEQKPRKLPNLVNCSGPQDCARAWEKAEAYVRKHATTPMQMIGKNIIMTAAPSKDQDISITVSRIRNKDRGKTILFMDLFCKQTPLGTELCQSEQVASIREAFANSIGETSKQEQTSP